MSYFLPIHTNDTKNTTNHNCTYHGFRIQTGHGPNIAHGFIGYCGSTFIGFFSKNPIFASPHEHTHGDQGQDGNTRQQDGRQLRSKPKGNGKAKDELKKSLNGLDKFFAQTRLDSHGRVTQHERQGPGFGRIEKLHILNEQALQVLHPPGIGHAGGGHSAQPKGQEKGDKAIDAQQGHGADGTEIIIIYKEEKEEKERELNIVHSLPFILQHNSYMNNNYYVLTY